MNSPEERWKALYRYWLSKHVNGRPPSRGDLDPVTEIPRLIANLMILDVSPQATNTASSAAKSSAV